MGGPGHVRGFVYSPSGRHSAVYRGPVPAPTQPGKRVDPVCRGTNFGRKAMASRTFGRCSVHAASFDGRIWNILLLCRDSGLPPAIACPSAFMAGADALLIFPQIY